MRMLVLTDYADEGKKLVWHCGLLRLPYDCLVEAMKEWYQRYGIPRKLILEFRGEW